MTQDTLFAKIVRREIPADIVYQDDLVTAFRDLHPQAPVHILIVPNAIVPTADDVEPEHEAALGRMFTVARKVAEQACRFDAQTTARELEILHALAQGRSNKEIARMLDVEPTTVKWHLKNLFAKLDALNRRHAVDRARLLGILD